MRKLFLILVSIYANMAFGSQVLLVVDGKAITDLDVTKRIEAMKLLNSDFVATDDVKRSILGKLMNEELCNNEAKRLNIKTDREEVIAYFYDLGNSNGIPKDKLDKLIKNQSFYNQIENQVLWNNLISGVLAHKIKVSEAEIRDEQKLRKGLIKEVTFKNITFSSIDPNKLEQMRIEAQSCDTLDEISKKFNLAKPQKITLLIDELNHELQSVIRTIPENRLSDIIKAGNQSQVIMLCHKNILNNPQDIKQIKSELVNRKINFEAQKYLAELKKRVYIEYNLGK